MKTDTTTASENELFRCLFMFYLPLQLWIGSGTCTLCWWNPFPESEYKEKKKQKKNIALGGTKQGHVHDISQVAPSAPKRSEKLSNHRPMDGPTGKVTCGVVSKNVDRRTDLLINWPPPIIYISPYSPNADRPMWYSSGHLLRSHRERLRNSDKL